MCQDTFSSFAVIAVGMQQGAFCATNNSISGIKHHQHLQPDMEPKFTWECSKATAKHTTPGPRKKAPINKRNPSKGSD
jgi:hypothetical protein